MRKTTAITTRTTLYFYTTTNLGRMHSWQRGKGDFYYDDDNEDDCKDNDHNDDDDNDKDKDN